MWVALQGDTPIGYVAGHLTRRFGCDGELQWIYVVREHRRAHVASRLLHLLAHWFLEHDARYVCVDGGDDAARRSIGDMARSISISTGWCGTTSPLLSSRAE